MKIISVIPARGGSKGILGKNIIDIKGKPLIYYSINASIQSVVEETWVSTDSEEIANVSYECGARILMRPKELAGDVIMPDESLIHFAENQDFDLLVFIQPTSPLIKSIYITNAVDMMITKGYDSMFTAHKYHWLPEWICNGNDCVPSGWDINNRPRRQDIAQSTYIENGMFYITTRDSLLKTKLRYGGKIGMFEIPLLDSFGVDSFDDSELIRKIL